MKWKIALGGVIPLAAFFLAFGVASFLVKGAGAAADLRCSETARAYASGGIGGIQGVRFLRNCVTARVETMKAGDAVAKAKPKGELNPLLCHQYAGEFAVDSAKLTAEKFAYLEACLDQDIAEMEQGR